MLRSSTLIAAVLASVALPAMGAALQKRDHVITFANRCGSKTITPIYHADTDTRTLDPIAAGQTTSTTVSEAQLSWRVFGTTGECPLPDGGGCTLLECSFDNPDFRQCNLSRVDGFNLGVEFSFSDGNCAGNDCLNVATCDGNHAFTTDIDGGNSLRQCNTPNVGMTVTFSCD